MASFCLVVSATFARFKSAKVGTSTRLGTLLFVVALSLGSTAFAQGFGVVLASFSKPENADRYRAQFELDIPEENLELTVLPADGAGGQSVYRVVAQTRDRSSRDLLERMRRIGFSDAWHIKSQVCLASQKTVTAFHALMLELLR